MRAISYGADLICAEARSKGMRYDEVRELLRRYFANTLAEHKEKVGKNGRISPFIRRTFEEDVARLRSMAGKTPTDQTALVLDWMVIEDILRSAGMDMPDGEVRQRILKEYQAASLSYSEAVLSFDQSLASYDLNPAPIAGQPVSRAGAIKAVSLKSLIKQFRDFNTAQGLWTSSTALERDRHFDLLSELVGTDDAVAVTYDVARNVRDMLLKMPANRNKRQSTKALSIVDQVANTSAPRMQARTIKKHMQTFHALFAWAALEKQIDTNPFDGITVQTNARVTEGSERLPFSEDQLLLIFATLVNLPNDLVRMDYQRWGPLIGMFSGARLNEICQLQVEDVRLQDGVWCLDLNDEGDETSSLKTSAGKRVVPIHSKLIELGLLEYVEGIKLAKKSRLFPELTYDPKNKWGRQLSRWFNERFLVKLGMKSKRLTFHSLRHTMVHRLLNSDVEEPIVKAVIGHKAEGVTQATYNRAGYSIARKKTAIEAYGVPGKVTDTDTAS